MTLSPGGAITGTLLDQTGQPATGACVSAVQYTHYHEGFAYPEYTVRADSKGRFTLSGLQPDSVRAEIDRENGGPIHVTHLYFGSFKGKDNIDCGFATFYYDLEPNGMGTPAAAGQTTDIGT